VLIAASNFLVPNSTFVVELLIFLVVLGVLAKWVLPYLNKAIEARQHSIEQTLQDAEETKKRALELEEQQRQALAESRQEARALKEEAARVGDQLRQELQKRGEEEYQRLVARAGADIEASARRAAEELRAQVAGLVVTVVERVLGEGIVLADQKLLIERAITEVESTSSGPAVGAAALAAPGDGRLVE
jgi:F-type H+-transporting ATPase subunit b